MAAPEVSQFQSSTKMLDRLLADVKDQVGKFLSNEKTLLSIEPRIDALTRVPQASVVQTGKVLQGKYGALYTVQKNTEVEAITFMTKGGDLKTKIDTNPLYAFIKTPVSTWGLRQYQILGDLAKEAGALVGPASGLTSRLLAQNKNVAQLVKEVGETEKAAAGSGFLPKIQGLIKGTAGELLGQVTAPLQKLLIPVAVVAAVAGAIWFLPRNMLRKK